MAQYGDEMHRREVIETDEHGNPIRITQEKLVQSTTGGQYEREVHHTGGTMGDYGSAGVGQHQGLGQAATGTHNTGTYGTTGHQVLGTGPDYSSRDRLTGQTGYQGGLGTEHGSTIGPGHHQRLGEVIRGTGTGTDHKVLGTGTDYSSGDRSTDQTGYQGLGTERRSTTGGQGHHQGLGDVTRGTGTGTHGTGTDFPTSGRSIGQTGYQGLGTEPGSGGTTGAYESRHDPTPMGGAGIGTGTGDAYRHTGTGDTHEKKGMMEKIKEKLPGHH